MKTFTKTTALFFAALLLSLNIFATGFDFEDEKYIDDIPFNTSEVILQISYENALTVDYSLSEEEYIDDIPSDIVNNSQFVINTDSATQEFCFEDEEYIDDISSAIVNQSCNIQYASAK
jgi:hypothetical protein